MPLTLKGSLPEQVMEGYQGRIGKPSFTWIMAIETEEVDKYSYCLYGLKL